MTKKEKIIFIIGLTLISLSLFFPLWRIELYAPQYPEGLFMDIHSSKITGDVDQINILNHYVGMQYIVPDEVPELKVMPYALSLVVILGIVVLFFKTKFIPRIWFFLSTLLCTYGLYDFYMWGYRYGHELSPDAPIKVPGLSYQPPFIGYQKILNIEAYSIPITGAIGIGLGLLLAFIVLFRKKKWLTFLSMFLFVACTNTVDPIAENVDSCDHCHMKIMDNRFSSALLTKKGRTYKFDAITCLKKYMNKSEDGFEEIYVSDFFNKNKLLKSSEAKFVTDSTIMGPMGKTPIASQDEMKLKEIGSQIVKWQDL